MKLEIKTLDNGIKQIELSGRLDLAGSILVDDQFTSHVVSQKVGVLVDLSNVDFIASIGMRLIISNAKELASRGGKIVLFNPTPLVKGALKTAGFDQLISIFDDYQSAYDDLTMALRSCGS